MRDASPILFRGEQSGALRSRGDWLNPYFLAEDLEHAQRYAGRGTEPIACVLHCKRVLDLTRPDQNNPEHQRILSGFAAEYDDWTCRYSGDPRDVWSYIESGDLYDYEGTGSGTRWKHLFRFALDEYDAVRILDCTDGSNGAATPVWVTIHRDHIRQASIGEQLWARLQQRPLAETTAWLERNHPDLITRINRLTVVDNEYRLDNLANIVPPEELRKLPSTGPFLTIWRGAPLGARTRPGDWVSLDRTYAEQHGDRTLDRSSVDALPHVLATDIYWSGTDMREFFYLPEAWRRDGQSVPEYLQSLSRDMVISLADGELSCLTNHKDALTCINTHVVDQFDEDNCGLYHGPDHWARVSSHAICIARALAISPLLPYVFGMVHDSQRQSEGLDPWHGRRAADFVKRNREGLFSFLADEDIRLLSEACADHSEGLTEAPVWVQACWDADRLDLGRVNVCPDPELLCTSYARQPHVITRALELSGAAELAREYITEQQGASFAADR